MSNANNTLAENIKELVNIIAPKNEISFYAHNLGAHMNNADELRVLSKKIREQAPEDAEVLALIDTVEEGCHWIDRAKIRADVIEDIKDQSFRPSHEVPLSKAEVEAVNSDIEYQTNDINDHLSDTEVKYKEAVKQAKEILALRERSTGDNAR